MQISERIQFYLGNKFDDIIHFSKEAKSIEYYDNIYNYQMRYFYINSFKRYLYDKGLHKYKFLIQPGDRNITNIKYNKSFLLNKYKKKINKLLTFGNYNVINYIQLLKSFNLLDKTKINNNILNELLKNIDYNNNLFNNSNIRNVYFILKFLVKQKMICFNKVKNKLSEKIYTKYSLINNYYLKKLFKYFNVDFINMFKLKS